MKNVGMFADLYFLHF